MQSQTSDTDTAGIRKLIFVFLDGVGLGDDGPENPLAVTKLPFLEAMLGAPLLKDIVVRRSDLLCKGIDACMDVPGIPQSATGQTALLTGFNAARHLGYHLPAFPNTALIDLIHRDSLLETSNRPRFTGYLCQCLYIAIL